MAQAAPSFSERMAGWLNGASITLAISIGHQTGLFDAMDSLRQSSQGAGNTVEEIARAASLQQRYVQVAVDRDTSY